MLFQHNQNVLGVLEYLGKPLHLFICHFILLIYLTFYSSILRNHQTSKSAYYCKDCLSHKATNFFCDSCFSQACRDFSKSLVYPNNIISNEKNLFARPLNHIQSFKRNNFADSFIACNKVDLQNFYKRLSLDFGSNSGAGTHFVDCTCENNDFIVPFKIVNRRYFLPYFENPNHKTIENKSEIIENKEENSEDSCSFLKPIIDEVRNEMNKTLNNSNSDCSLECYQTCPDPETSNSENSDHSNLSEISNEVEQITSGNNDDNVNSDDNEDKIPNNLFKRVGKVRFACYNDSPDSISDASISSITASVSLVNSTEYTGTSDRYGYSRHRDVPPRNSRDHQEPDLRDPVEQHHHHHHHHHHREGSVKRGQFARSLSNTEPPVDEKTGEY